MALTHPNPPKEEITNLYNDLSEKWWSKEGGAKLMHISCDVIYPYMRSKIIGKAKDDEKTLKDIKVLDIGCGGGIMTEKFAKDGALATGIDINDKVIEVAKWHASLDSTISDRLTYLVEPIEEHSKQNEGKYDVIILKYVLLHIVDQEKFMNHCIKCLKPNGSIFLCTVSKTWTSWLYYQLLWEKILRICPKEYYNWNMFTTPEDLSQIVLNNGCKIEEVRGSYHNRITRKYCWTQHHYLDYVAHIIKS
uniref:3-demethylubiquinol 3-O-methyltransferase n=1 Tax=Photinus pyralis TaxID=7054 RepID=A0A1Y1K593_PHOPY